MLLPIGTDAPVYHFPWMTIVLIVANTISFVLTGAGHRPELWDGWLLQFGNGLHPVEWLGWNFLHFGFMHLIGNMFFLWAFGLVVEGKIGWWKYLLVYLGVGVLGGFFVQLCMLGADVPKLPHGGQMLAQVVPPIAGDDEPEPVDEQMENLQFDPKNFDPKNPQHIEKLKKMKKVLDEQQAKWDDEEADLDELAAWSAPPGAGGASLAIYGLVAIALIWAPKNEISMVGFVVYRPVAFDIEILYLAGFYIFMQFLVGFLFGFAMSSEVLHLVGAILGFGVGIAMFKAKLVDCENWDVFAVMNGTYGAYGDTSTRLGADLARYRAKIYSESVSEPEEVKQPKQKEPKQLDPETIESHRNAALKRMRAALQQEKVLVALSEYRKAQSLDRSKHVEGPDLKGLINSLCKAKMWSDATPILEEYVKRVRKGSEKLRLTLATIYIDQLGRPNAALRSLKPIDRKSLDKPPGEQYDRLVKQAKQMIDDGVLEFDESEAAAGSDEVGVF